MIVMWFICHYICTLTLSGPPRFPSHLAYPPFNHDHRFTLPHAARTLFHCLVVASPADPFTLTLAVLPRCYPQNALHLTVTPLDLFVELLTPWSSIPVVFISLVLHVYFS